MKKSLFRSEALDRVASPEQLDTLMVVTSRRAWLIMASCGMVVAALVAWSVLGAVPTRVRGDGILLVQGGVQVVSAPAGARLEQILVASGTEVRKNQPLARLALPDLQQKVAAQERRVAEREAQQNQDLSLREEETKLKKETLSQRNTNARKRMRSLGRRMSVLSKRLKSQARLLESGLITSRTLEATQLQLEQARSERQNLKATLQTLKSDQQGLSSDRARKALDQKHSLAEARRELGRLRKQLELRSVVRSPHAGRVLEMRAAAGDLVAAGAPLMNLERRGDGGTLEAVLYAPAHQGMALAPGMVVHLEPSTARREEFGYLVGRVRSVASFPATPDGMLRSLGNEILAQDLMRRAGDVVLEVRVTLDPSDTTFTGFQWTTQAGPENKLEAGTPTAGYITVRTQTPLRLLFPSLAKRLGA